MSLVLDGVAFIPGPFLQPSNSALRAEVLSRGNLNQLSIMAGSGVRRLLRFDVGPQHGIHARQVALAATLEHVESEHSKALPPAPD